MHRVCPHGYTTRDRRGLGADGPGCHGVSDRLNTASRGQGAPLFIRAGFGEEPEGVPLLGRPGLNDGVESWSGNTSFGAGLSLAGPSVSCAKSLGSVSALKDRFGNGCADAPAAVLVRSRFGALGAGRPGLEAERGLAA